MNKLFSGRKDNSRKSGAQARMREQKRAEAIERNTAYQALTLDEKLARNSTRVREKLLAKES